MSDMNLDIIQNKLDALVEKIIQNESSNEDFRITYAQILEKINTKIDVFSGTENLEKLAYLSMEIRDAFSKRQDVIDGKFAAIKSEFDRVNDILINSFRSSDIVTAYEKIDNSMKIQQAETNSMFAQIADFLNGFNALKETNELMKNNFALIKEQNTIASENFAKQVESLKNCNGLIEDSNEKTLKNFETVLYTLQEFSESLNDDFSDIKSFISDKVNDLIGKVQETDSYIEVLNSNLSTLIEVVGNIFDDENFTDLQSDVTDILGKTVFIADSLKKLAEKDDVNDIKSLLTDLEQCICKNASEKTEFINNVKDTIIEELTDVVSAEGVAVSNQLTGISENITDVSQKLDTIKDNTASEIQKAISDESKVSNDRMQKITTSIDEVSSRLDLLNKDISEAVVKESVETSEQIQVLAEAVSDFKNGLAEMKSAIEEKISASDSNAAIESVKTTLTNVVLNQQSEQIANALNDLQSKFVTQIMQIAENITFDEEVYDITSGVQEISDELKETIETKIVDSSSELFEKVSDVIQKTNDSIDEKIVNNIENVSSSLLEQVSNVVTETAASIEDSISTSIKTSSDVLDEKISSVINNNTVELKSQIASDISAIKEDISSIIQVSSVADNNILDVLDKIVFVVKNDINSDLKSLISGFKILTNGLNDEKDYVYTLPDIEADLSKIRGDLNKLQEVILETDSQNVEAGASINSKIDNIRVILEKLENSALDADIAEVKSLFSTLSEDISSISKRTNKLILSSDEVSKTLNNNIKIFSSLLKAFDKQSSDFYNSGLWRELCQRVVSLAKTGSEISQTTKITNEAFMYLAEWVDSASETFEDVTTGVSDVKNELSVVKEKLFDITNDTNSDIVIRNLNGLGIKAEEQDSKINELESKIDSIDEKLNRILAAQNDSKETKSLLEFVTSQITAVNEKFAENEKLALKMASMDKQLKKIERNIAIITEYIDEDDDFEIEK